MDQFSHETKPATADIHCQNMLPEDGKSTPVKRPDISLSQQMQAKLVCPTPEKTDPPMHVEGKKEILKLPEMYETLYGLFGGVIGSLRLLKLRKRLPMFRKICKQVEILTERKLSYSHLAQMKFLLPEAVYLEKVLIHNSQTMCLEPDTKVTLVFDVVEGHNEQHAYTALRQMFYSRLEEFICMYPEGREIPKAELPELYNQKKISISGEHLVAGDSLAISVPNINETELKSSYQPFSRRFSKNAVGFGTQKSQSTALALSSSPKINDFLNTEDTETMLQEPSSNLCFEQVVLENSAKEAQDLDSTPMKFALESYEPILETPAQSTPKRSAPADDKLKTMTGSASNLSAKRSLTFSNLEAEELFPDSFPGDNKYQDIQSLGIKAGGGKGMLEEENVTCSTPLLKDDAIKIGGLMSEEHVASCLPDLVAIINCIFQSGQWTSITKNELVYKIMVNKLDVVDNKEIEQQIDDLEKMVPDWITRKVALSGDVLYSVKQVSDLNSFVKG